MSDSSHPSRQLLDRAAELIVEKRGSDVVALEVGDLVDYMDYLLIATGRSARQNRAIAENVIRGLKKEGHLPLSRSGLDAGEWICLDFVDVVIHLFDGETRDHYDLELLWADGTPVELALPSVPVTAGAEDDDEPYEEGVIEPPSA